MKKVLQITVVIPLLALVVSTCGGPEESKKFRLLPEERKALSPGEYRSEEFEPSVSFRVGVGWSSFPPEASDDLRLTHGEKRLLRFLNVQQVFKPTTTGTPDVVEAPGDIVGWFQRHPHLQTSKPAPATVEGVRGQQFDVVLANLPEDYSGVCGTECVDVTKTSTDPVVALPKGYKAHVIVLEDMKGETVIISFVSPASDFDEFAPEAEKVLDTVEWTGT